MVCEDVCLRIVIKHADYTYEDCSRDYEIYTNIRFFNLITFFRFVCKESTLMMMIYDDMMMPIS